MFTYWPQLCIVLASLWIGMRMKGVGLGIMSGLGLLVLVVFFGVEPCTPAYKVILVMCSALMAAAGLEAAGTLKALTYHAGQLLSKQPHAITWLSPLLSYSFVWAMGTSHIMYVLLPVIARVARQSGIRPEKPLVASVLASQQALLASPVSAATAIVLANWEESDTVLTLMDTFKTFVPATLVGTYAATWVVHVLHEDPKYCLVMPEEKELRYKTPTIAWLALGCFMLGVATVVSYSTGVFMYTRGTGKDLAHLVAMIMLGVAAVIACFTGTKAFIQGRIFLVGMQAVIAILGVTWLGRSFLMHHLPTLKRVLCFNNVWQWGIGLFLLTILTSSQGTSLQLALPLGLATLGPKALFYILPAVNSFYVLPSYPTITAAVALDKSGSTRIGKFVLNHSFLLPGLVGTFTSCLTAYIISLL